MEGDPFVMDGDNVESEPEVTVETVDDNIEMGFSDPTPGPGWLEYIKFSILVYFSNPWALLVLAFLFYKLYYRIKPLITEPLTEK